ncbi:MAG TPA: hypothetical protein VF230_07895, partial [Acidimicrobiales bacterium]
QRTPLFPESAAIIEGLRDAGALGACWSGAGPTVLAACHRDRATAVRDAGDALLASLSVAGVAMVVAADRSGLVVE